MKNSWSRKVVAGGSTGGYGVEDAGAESGWSDGELMAENGDASMR
jgi:hypothetical protein